MYFQENVKPQSDDPMTFLKNRKAGAEAAAKAAKEKGGDAILSYYHFEAKDKPYAEIIKVLRNSGIDDAKKLCKQKYKQLLSDVDLDMDQKEYQAVVGKLEVYGECYIKFLDLM